MKSKKIFIKMILFFFTLSLSNIVFFAEDIKEDENESKLIQINYYQGKLNQEYLPFNEKFEIVGSTKTLNCNADAIELKIQIKDDKNIIEPSYWIRFQDDVSSSFKIIVDPLVKWKKRYELTFTFFKKFNKNDDILNKIFAQISSKLESEFANPNELSDKVIKAAIETLIKNLPAELTKNLYMINENQDKLEWIRLIQPTDRIFNSIINLENYGNFIIYKNRNELNKIKITNSIQEDKYSIIPQLTDETKKELSEKYKINKDYLIKIVALLINDNLQIDAKINNIIELEDIEKKQFINAIDSYLNNNPPNIFLKEEIDFGEFKNEIKSSQNEINNFLIEKLGENITKDKLINTLNDILKIKDFYNKTQYQDIKDYEQIKNLYNEAADLKYQNKYLNENKLSILNRSLLELNYKKGITYLLRSELASIKNLFDEIEQLQEIEKELTNIAREIQIELKLLLENYFLINSRIPVESILFAKSKTELDRIMIGTAYGFGAANLVSDVESKIDPFSFVGLKFYLGPVDRQKAKPFITKLSRWSITISAVFNSNLSFKGQKQNDLLGGIIPLFGISYDLNPFALNLGTIFFRQPSNNPLASVTDDSPKMALYFGISFDFDILNRINGLIKK